MRKRIILFFQSAIAGGIMLISASVLGMIFADTSILSGIYVHFLHSEILNMPTHVIINDAMMSVFFLYVGLEVKREMLVGQLNTNSKRLFPGLAALCGFIVPAILFFLFNHSGAPAKVGQYRQQRILLLL